MKFKENKPARALAGAIVGVGVLFSLSSFYGCEGADQRIARLAVETQSARFDNLQKHYVKIESNRRKIVALGMAADFERLNVGYNNTRQQVEVMREDPIISDTSSQAVNGFEKDVLDFERLFKTKDSMASVLASDAAIIGPKLDFMALHAPVQHAQWVKNQSRLLSSIMRDVSSINELYLAGRNLESARPATSIERKLLRLSGGFEKVLGSQCSLVRELNEFSRLLRQVYSPADLIHNPYQLGFSHDFWEGVMQKANDTLNYK